MNLCITTTCLLIRLVLINATRTRTQSVQPIRKLPLIPIYGQQPIQESLPFLLRTLDQRPDLGLYVRSVCVDWYDNRAFTKGFEMEGALIRLFECCPRLQRLVIPDLPSIDTIMKMSASQITTLACVYSPRGFLCSSIFYFAPKSLLQRFWEFPLILFMGAQAP